MAYYTLDDDALAACVDDSQMASWLLRQLVTNFQAVWDERLPQCSWESAKDAHLRLHSPWPTAACMGFIRLPRGEEYRTITLRVKVQSVDFDDESGGADAVDVWAGVADPRTGRFEPPPMLPEHASDLSGASDWTTLTKTASGAQQELTATIPRGVDGDVVAVLLWYRSRVRETAEGTFDCDEIGWRGKVGIQLTASGSDMPAGVPERCLRFTVDDGGNATDLPAGMHLVGFYETNAAAHPSHDGTAWVIPVARDAPVPDADFTVTTHTMGVAQITGASIEPVAPAYPIPTVAAYRTDQPLDTRVLQLAEATENLIRARQPQSSCWPGMESNYAWHFRDEAELDSAQYRPMKVWLVDEETQLSANGVGGWLVDAWYALQYSGRGATPTEAVVTWRLSAYSIGAIIPGTTTPIVSNTATPVRSRVQNSTPGAEQPILTQTLWGIEEFGSWALRGSLMHMRPETSTDFGRHDIRMQNYISLRLPETSITYPCYMALECIVGWDVSLALTGFCAARSFEAAATR